jgi:hypothetical protein
MLFHKLGTNIVLEPLNYSPLPKAVELSSIQIEKLRQVIFVSLVILILGEFTGENFRNNVR